MEALKPELIAPVVGWLCHEDCDANGSLIEAAGGWAGKCKFSFFFSFSALVYKKQRVCWDSLDIVYGKKFSYFFTDRWQRSQGALLIKSLSEGSPTIEAVRDNWDQIIDMDSGADFPTSNQGATMELVGKLRPLSDEEDEKAVPTDEESPVRPNKKSHL